MRSQIRLRVLLPLLIVAVAGLGFVKFGFGALGLGPDTAEPVAASANAPNSSAKPKPADPATTGATETQPSATTEAPAPPPVDTSGGTEALTAALAQNKVVVLVLYSPDGNVDTLVTGEARLAAQDVGAGFVAVDAAREKMVGDLALTYDLRETPAVLVFTRGPELKTKLVGWADRETVAQAAQDARRR